MGSMDPMWLAVRYLLDRAYCRARAALDGNPESGALTLEWLVIAGILVGAAALTATFLRGEDRGMGRQDPLTPSARLRGRRAGGPAATTGR